MYYPHILDLVQVQADGSAAVGLWTRVNGMGCDDAGDFQCVKLPKRSSSEATLIP